MDFHELDQLLSDIQENKLIQPVLIEDEDVRFLSKALEGCIHLSLEDFAAFSLELSEMTLQNIGLNEERSVNRPSMIRTILYKWKEEKLQDATFQNFKTILDSKDLVATLQCWTISYCDDEEKKKSFMQLKKEVEKFARAMAKCLSDEDFDLVMTKLSISERTGTKLNTIHRWIETNGFLKATIVELKTVLKDLHLRHKIVQIENPTEEYQQMCSLFCKSLEDLWKTLLTLSNVEQNLIFDHLVGVQNSSEEPAFAKVIKEGNEGFHSFIKALKTQIVNFDAKFGHNQRKLFKIQNVSEVNNENFIQCEGFDDLSRNFSFSSPKKFLAISGSDCYGQHQWALKISAKFITNYPVCIVWSLDCANVGIFKDSLLSLNQKMVDAGVMAKVRDDENTIVQICGALKCSDFHVLLLLFNCSKEVCASRDWNDLVQELKKMDKVSLLANLLANSVDLPQDFDLFEFKGPSQEEAKVFLLDPTCDCSEEETNAVKYLCEMSTMDLSILKSFKQQNESLSYADVLSMRLNPESKTMFEQFEKKWQEENCGYLVSTSGSATTSKQHKDELHQKNTDEIAYFWDAQYCLLPPDAECFEKAICKMRKKFQENHREATFVVHAEHSLSEEIKNVLLKEQVTAISSVGKEASLLINEMEKWIFGQNHQPKKIVVITGNPAMLPLLTRLENERVNVIAIFGGNLNLPRIHQSFRYDSFFEDLNMLSCPPKIPERTFNDASDVKKDLQELKERFEKHVNEDFLKLKNEIDNQKAEIKSLKLDLSKKDKENEALKLKLAKQEKVITRLEKEAVERTQDYAKIEEELRQSDEKLKEARREIEASKMK